MGRHSTTLSGSAGTVARARLKGAAPQVYAGDVQTPAPSFPLWLWFLLLGVAVVLLIVSAA